MIAMPFDSLQFAKKLKAAKDPEAQAEVVAEVFRVNFGEIREGFDERDKELADVKAKLQTLAADAKSNAEKMATKEDIQQLRKDLEAGQKDLQKDLEAGQRALRQEIVIANKDLLIKLGGAIGVAVGVILAAMRWMPHA